MLTSGSPGYLCELNNFLAQVRAVSAVPVTVGVYHNQYDADRRMTHAQKGAFARRIDTRGETRLLWRDAASPTQSFWAWRLALLCELLAPSSPHRLYEHVVFTDVDAVWRRDPVPTLSALHARGFSVVASTGTYPPAVQTAWRERFGFDHTLCMGFVSFAADEQTSGIVRDVLERCEASEDRQSCDDQISINKWIDASHGLSWEASIHSEVDFEGLVNHTAESAPWRVAAVSQSFVARPEAPALEYSPDAAVLHPLSDKNGAAVREMLTSLGLWRLGECGETQEEIVPGIPTGL